MKVQWDLRLVEHQEAYLYVEILVSLFVSQSDCQSQTLSQRGETTRRWLIDFKKKEYERDVQRFKGWLRAIRAERSNQEMQT